MYDTELSQVISRVKIIIIKKYWCDSFLLILDKGRKSLGPFFYEYITLTQVGEWTQGQDTDHISCVSCSLRAVKRT